MKDAQHADHFLSESLPAPLAAAAEIAASVDAIADLVATARVNLLGLVGVDVSAQIDAIVAVNVDLIVVRPFLLLYSIRDRFL